MRSEPRDCVLVVDDDPLVLEGLTALLEETWDVKTALTGREAIVAFSAGSPGVVLLDVQLPDASGIELLRQFKMYSETVAVIMMSGAGTLDRVVESMKLGAETFLQKPFGSEVLLAAMQQVSRMIAARRELIALRRSEGREARLAGISPSIGQLNDVLSQVARASSPVLIEGESGTGKGVFARLIHNRSDRASGPFVDLNCAGLSRELLESELFGHERGAFTNAMSTKPGLFEVANAGTLFLDEIGEMEITVQARLLKALEDKRFRRVGGVRDLRSDFRLVAATSRDISADIVAGRFRADLYYRLNVVRVRMPPLRERMDDLPLLAETILGTIAGEMGRAVPQISPAALEKLKSSSWPGNIRELRNVLERALLLQTGRDIRNDHIVLERQDGRLASVAASKSSTLPSESWEIQPLDQVIAQYVAAAVRAAGGNVRKAARQLEISPSTLYARLKQSSAEESDRH
jgi:Response regulator containing CheY-like receiver, AAA-type ATPase, and DNA-binding domains